jgi:pimeloyl-ACP methyl ester carboxylesterase
MPPAFQITAVQLAFPRNGQRGQPGGDPWTARVFGLALLASVAYSTPSPAAPPQLETKSFTIPSVDPGVELYMRNKHPVGMTAFSEDKTVLFIHGATYPAESAFDLPSEGVSMMDLIAQQGYDVYLIDVRGYGGSTRPPEMDQPRNLAKLDLMGWSWGTSTAGFELPQSLALQRWSFCTPTGHHGRFSKLSEMRAKLGVSCGII